MIRRVFVALGDGQTASSSCAAASRCGSPYLKFACGQMTVF